jgi:hypothetical protein
VVRRGESQEKVLYKIPLKFILYIQACNFLMLYARRALFVRFTLAEWTPDGFNTIYPALYIEYKSCNTLLYYTSRPVAPLVASAKEIVFVLNEENGF